MGRSGRVNDGGALGWYDIDSTMALLEAHHSCVVSIVVTRVRGSLGILQVALIATHMPDTSSPALPHERQCVSVAYDYLAGGTDRWEPRLYRELLRLDRELDGAWWRQSSLGLYGTDNPTA